MEDTNEQTSLDTPPKRWLRKFWALLPGLAIFSFLVLVILVLGGRIKSEGEVIKSRNMANLDKENPALNVVVLELVPMPIRDRMNLPGIVEPWKKLQVVAQVQGKIVDKNLEEGQAVSKEDVIAVIDRRDYRIAYTNAKTSYEVALSDLKRLETLRRNNVIPQSQLDNATAQVENAKATLENAILALERCEIKADMDGVVNRMHIENGQYLSVGDPVADLLQIDRLKINVGIPESDIEDVRGLTEFDVRIDALGGETFRAGKHFVSFAAEDLARLYTLELELNNTDGRILPDMFVRVEIVKKEIKDSLSLPIYSVISRNDENIVYVVADGVARARRVSLGLLEGWRVQVTDGLSAGDRVIVVGQRSVNTGDKVNVVRSVTRAEDIIL
jgi:RND family efflux transporter MFP subunit